MALYEQWFLVIFCMTLYILEVLFWMSFKIYGWEKNKFMASFIVSVGALDNVIVQQENN